MLQEPLSTNCSLIVGGGFGGLTAALSLAEQQPRSPVVLIEPGSQFLFQPHLYELLSDELQAWEVAPAYRDLISNRGISWIQDRVVSIDTSARTVSTASGHRLPWSQLLLACGSRPNDFGIPGVKDNALGFQNLDDVHTLKCLIRDLRQRRLSHAALVIVGAGPTGVELACKLADLLTGSARLHLIEQGATILPNSPAFNRERAVAALERRDVTVHLNTAVTAVTPTSVELGSGTPLAHHGLIWTAGSRPNLPEMLPAPAMAMGRLAIDATLRLVDQPSVFAIGDLSCCESDPWPSTAQVAMQQGVAVARSIHQQQQHQDEEPAPFRFEDRGEMLSLGIGDATLTGMGITLAGPLAFGIRRATYLTRLPGLSLGLRSAGAWLLGR
ncbi:hypothetical protein KR100_14260 [Synechococcus sp. KORDI-100]|uniref:NAD(P)/FAD-dependent oxidoreductase n=1 Tax=Synechococcus sp. KORDI-100 TaxID=1280380 RepID=UPI0004E06C49|nr:NAD(P)/FAD-dependent oxidoreductase [Synechococcus sp. KORDI-100]AII44512.1 hypothetical protein KR100_14260 [Synechococcus sp. KORDI-100]